MSTSPIESVFGAPERPGDSHDDVEISELAGQRNADTTETAPAPGAQGAGTEIEWTNAELHSIGAPSRNCNASSSPTHAWAVLQKWKRQKSRSDGSSSRRSGSPGFAVQTRTPDP